MQSAIKNDIINLTTKMTRKEKRFLKLLENPKEATLSEIVIVLRDFGYELERIKGSHFIFKGVKGDIIILPAHNNKVKKYYIKTIIQKIYNLFYEEN